MPIGEFGGAAALPGDGSPFLSAPMYWFYEMGHAALTPARAFADAGAHLLQESRQSVLPYRRRQGRGGGVRTVRAHDAPLQPARLGHRLHHGRRRARPGAHRAGLGAAVLPAAAFRARARPRAAAAAAEAADRRADVRPLRDAAARHRRGVPAESRRLHHRLGRRAHGAARRRPLRSRRLHRLRDLDAACARTATRMWSRCASLRCRCSRQSPAWKRRTIPTCRCR